MTTEYNQRNYALAKARIIELEKELEETNQVLEANLALQETLIKQHPLAGGE